MSASPLTQCDLHVHTWGCYHPEDLVHMARDCHRDVDWNLFNFPQVYENAHGTAIDPAAIFEEAVATGSMEKVRDVSVCGPGDGGSFERFDTKTLAAVCITRYWIERDRLDVVLEPIIRRHRGEGLEYVEYRCGFGDAPFERWYPHYLRYLKNSCTDTFTARAVVRLSRDDVMGSYERLRDLVDAEPDLLDMVVGVDFGGREIPPERLGPFFTRLHRDNERSPTRALDAVLHVGEVFSDRSLESAIRWCHRAAELGAVRLGHCTALGLNPQVAVARHPGAHTVESLSERLDQIAYDLRWQDQLSSYGVRVDEARLRKELDALLLRHRTGLVRRDYDDVRLDEARRRQDFVLDELRALGTVIEICPTSTLRIAGIFDMESHPVRKFYDAGVNLAICSDDPGVFNSPLASEVDLVAQHLGVTPETLARRLGDPRAFRLGGLRGR